MEQKQNLLRGMRPSKAFKLQTPRSTDLVISNPTKKRITVSGAEVDFVIEGLAIAQVTQEQWAAMQRVFEISDFIKAGLKISYAEGTITN